MISPSPDARQHAGAAWLAVSSMFDVIILLSAPPQILIERLAARTSNPYGKSPGELRRVLEDLETVEPRLRRAADHEIRTTMPLGAVVAEVLRVTDA